MILLIEDNFNLVKSYLTGIRNLPLFEHAPVSLIYSLQIQHLIIIISFLGFVFCPGYLHCYYLHLFSLDVSCFIFQPIRNIDWSKSCIVEMGSNFHMLKLKDGT
jgi:hypothetical protein